ncbi:MAG: hypothetical protein QME81_03760 [bacterium]|nr:hypothetical protein [bacterium]
MTAFARWRLMLTYLLMGELGGAQLEYNRLQADYPTGAADHVVAALAEAFWMAYLVDGRIADGCIAAIAAAETDTSVQDFFNVNINETQPKIRRLKPNFRHNTISFRDKYILLPRNICVIHENYLHQFRVSSFGFRVRMSTEPKTRNPKPILVWLRREAALWLESVEKGRELALWYFP